MGFKLSHIAMATALFTNAAFANTATAVNIQINSAPVAQCLQQLNQQTGVLVTLENADSQLFDCQSLQGNYTAKEALQNLFPNKNIVIEQKGYNHLVIKIQDKLAKLPDVHVTTPETIEVVGQRITRSSASTGLELSVKETPQSVSIIDMNFINDFNLDNIEQVMQSATGVYRYKYGAGDRASFYARGEQVNTFVKDGLPSAHAGVQEHRLDSVVYESIEVLRGGAGMMEGQGEASATLNLISKKASADNHVKVHGEIGSWQHYRAEVDINGALTNDEALTGRLVLAYQDNEEFTDFESRKLSVVYGQIGYQLFDNTDATATLHYQKNQQKGTSWGLPIFFSDGTPLHVERGTNLTSANAFNDNEYLSYQFTLSHEFNDNWSGRVAYHNSNSEFMTVMTYWSGLVDKKTGLGLKADDGRFADDVDGSTIAASLTGDFELFSQKHQVNFSLIRSNYEHKRYWFKPMNRYPVGSIYDRKPIDIPKFDHQERFFISDNIIETSASVNAKFQLIDNLFAIVGLKYNSFDHAISGTAPWIKVTDKDTNDLTHYFGLVYNMNDNVSLYASYVDVYLPQLTQLDRNLQSMDPATGVTQEAGVKTSFFDDALLINLSYFDIQKKNVAQLIPEFADDQVPRYRYADGVSGDGFEIEITGNITDNWGVTVGYTDYELKDEHGKDVNRQTPREMFNLHTQYQFNDWYFGLGYVWVGDTHVNISGVPGIDHGLPPGGRRGSLLGKHESRGLVDASVKHHINEQFRVQLNINNLLDKEYYDTFGFRPKKHGEPRSVILSVNYDF